ncbi:GNAT family N-acetyltransferase [Amycolatopsis sp. CA-230715]|uniref:GNAT family N-acetyltransferase n=1 Tax=Amycolatopsis sp. CA-230715 TaxID=2745196 RepID=UPI001C01AFC6|nr:GNAT family N-acetyltransferase [Amycolatopsis sp. CA-230715]QWF82897.1 hypothetical protein HUW46_06336 [Amycolatopsis sp. CA-230715]
MGNDGVDHVVDRFWAGVFGVGEDEVWRPGAHLSIDETAWPGLLVVRFGETVRVRAPEPLLGRARAAIGSRATDALFDPAVWLEVLAGLDPKVLGPSVHAYSGGPVPRGAGERLSRGELDALAAGVPEEEWQEAGMDNADAVLFGLRRNGTLVAAANLTTWDGAHTDVGVLTAPSARGRGHGTAIAATAAEHAIEERGIARWRALATNTASRAMAARLGFVARGAHLAVPVGRLPEPVARAPRDSG